MKWAFRTPPCDACELCRAEICDYDRAVADDSFSSETSQIGIVVRPATVGDVAAIANLFRSQVEISDLGSDMDYFVDRACEHIAWCLERSFGAIAEGNNTTLGFATTSVRDPGVLEIAKICVAAPYRRKGVGRDLASLVERQARQGELQVIMSTASSRWFPEGELPDQFFSKIGYQVNPISPDVHLYVRALKGRPNDKMTRRRQISVP